MSIRKITFGEVKQIRRQFGDAWNLGKPVSRHDLGLMLGLGGNPSNTVYDWERRRPETELTGPISAALHMMLHYGPPPMWLDVIFPYSDKAAEVARAWKAANDAREAAGLPRLPDPD